MTTTTKQILKAIGLGLIVFAFGCTDSMRVGEKLEYIQWKDESVQFRFVSPSYPGTVAEVEYDEHGRLRAIIIQRPKEDAIIE